MGYSFDFRGRMCCDSCGNPGGVRRRTCPHRVRYHDGGSAPYCYPPALCSACYAKHGGLRGVHGERCRDGAGEAQVREDRIGAKLAAGEIQVRAAWGRGGSEPSRYGNVPPGQVMVACSDDKRYLVDAAEYDRRTRDNFLSEFPSAVEYIEEE